MATKRIGTALCNLCCVPSVAICVACDRHFCWDHFCEHRQIYKKYLDDADNHRQPLSKCLVEFEQVEKELHSSIDNWERNKIADVHRSADDVRRALDTHINNYRVHFEEESSTVAHTESTNLDARLIQIEKLQIEYGRTLKNIRLMSNNDRQPMLQIETTDPTREEISFAALVADQPTPVWRL